MHFIPIKPLSINAAYRASFKIIKGKKVPSVKKSAEYRKYERDLLKVLPSIKVGSGPLEIIYEFGVSDSRIDWDNNIKAFQDILEKAYEFNDSVIMCGFVRKVKVKRGMEYIGFTIFEGGELSNCIAPFLSLKTDLF